MQSRFALTIGVIVIALSLAACGGDDNPPSPTATTQLPTPVPATATTEVRPSPSPTTTAPSPTTAPPPTNTPAPAATAAPRPTATPAASSGSSSSSGSTVIVPFPFDIAAQASASLLGTARFGPPMDPFDASNPLDLTSYPGWQHAYPLLRLVSPAESSTPSTVSVYRGTLNPGPAAATNPKVIAFTAAGKNGACRGALIRGFPTYNEWVEVDIATAPCNAQSALTAARMAARR